MVQQFRTGFDIFRLSLPLTEMYGTIPFPLFLVPDSCDGLHSGPTLSGNSSVRHSVASTGL